LRFLLFYLIERDKILGNIDTSHDVTQHNQYVSVNGINNKKTRDEVRCILREKFRK